MKKISQEELNSRIVQNDDHILLIFKDYKQLNLYRRNFGRDYKKILMTEYEVDNGRVVGLRYNNWNYIDEYTLDTMIKSLRKESQV